MKFFSSLNTKLIPRKQDLDTLSDDALLKRAHSIGVRFTDISGGTGDLAERLALAQFGVETLREKVRSKEREIEAGRITTLKKIGLYVAIAGGIVGIVWTLIQIKETLFKKQNQDKSVQY